MAIVANDDFITLINEMLEEDLAIIRDLFETDFVPILRKRQALEREAFDDAYNEMVQAEAQEIV